MAIKGTQDHWKFFYKIIITTTPTEEQNPPDNEIQPELLNNITGNEPNNVQLLNHPDPNNPEPINEPASFTDQ